MSAVRNYILVTLAYWAFTLTDGALRMLVLLHFHGLGYSPVDLAFLFLFYEFFGVVTNLLGGYIAARLGLRVTLFSGLVLQVLALGMLSLLAPGWSKVASVAYVMGAQALSGIAKDLTKMSSKSSIKVLVPEDQSSSLFKWVAVLTGSKNALKGAGFFLGGLLLSWLGFRESLWAMAGALLLVLVGCVLSLPADMGRSKGKAKFTTILSKTRAINVLSAARFFLFGARDIWFVVGVPVFLSVRLEWGFREVGAFLALWVIGYGAIQSAAPALIRRWTRGHAPEGRATFVLAVLLAGTSVAMALGIPASTSPTAVLVVGLGVFGAIFAVNSSVHSYLILAYSDGDKVAMNVGFYYMANAGGRLVGTLLSGALYQLAGLRGCLWGTAAFAAITAGISLLLPRAPATLLPAGMELEGGD
ncbi:MAG: organoarsenical effux MFS transporter ArsJ [Sandaracinaceae bacterium]|nr:organoarsenical effux MFS transporter ArsJ [Sandaracinaceae bacterium]